MSSESGPVFIGGLDQSGKTPMRRILDASTDIAFSRRTYLWTLLAGRSGDLADDAALARCMKGLRQHVTLQQLGVDLDSVERSFRAGDRHDGRLFDLIGQSIAARAGKPRWGDQEAGVEERADLLLGLFPSARIIHMVRDPFGRHAAISARHRRRWGALGATIAPWLANARVAVRNVARHPDHYRIVRFEDLIGSPEATGRAVAAFIGASDAEAVALAAAAWAEGARRGEDPSLSWTTRHARGSDARFVGATAGREMDALGYPRPSDRLSPVEWLRYGVVTQPLNRGRAALSRAAGWMAAGSRMEKVRRSGTRP